MKPIVFIIIMLAPLAASAKKPDVALWLARSCVGEAGWDSYESLECPAIMHVYLKLALKTDVPLYRVTRKYSAAIKTRSTRARRWLLHLNREATRPQKWPKNVKWSVCRDRWKIMLKLADLFLTGHVGDPLPEARHYGGKMDKNLNPKHWVKIREPGFRNIFYKIRTRNDR